MTVRIFHICAPDQWQSQLSATLYTDPSLQTEGFIHCSTKEQLDPTLGRHFTDIPELIILEILPSAVAEILRFEAAPRSGELYPHIYGTIPKDAILRVHHFNWETLAMDLVDLTDLTALIDQ